MESSGCASKRGEDTWWRHRPHQTWTVQGKKYLCRRDENTVCGWFCPLNTWNQTRMIKEWERCIFALCANEVIIKSWDWTEGAHEASLLRTVVNENDCIIDPESGTEKLGRCLLWRSECAAMVDGWHHFAADEWRQGAFDLQSRWVDAFCLRWFGISYQS